MKLTMQNKDKIGISVIPDDRLMTAAKYIRRGSFVADVGTDHAYLPVWLCVEDLICGAVASDINAGPIARAEANIRAAGLSDRITTVKTDGLNGIAKYSPEDIIIFGMGGELISHIIESAEFVKNPKIRLILQPMTKINTLRKYLCNSGFAIIGETLSRDDGRIYQTIAAEYDGIKRELSNPQLYFGNLQGEPLWRELMAHELTVWETRRTGKLQGGIPTDEENEIIEYIKGEIGHERE